jgi:hypothetical protein
MRERDRHSLNEFRRQLAAEERAAEERRLAPIREAEAELRKTHGQLLKAERDSILTSPDPDVFIDPRFPVGKSIPMDQAADMARIAGENFVATHPEYFICSENTEAFVRYFQVNRLQILTLEMYEAAYQRLNSLGVLKQRPAREPEPETVEQPAPAPVQPEELIGVDESGREKAYTRAEVDRMSAEEYKRFFRLPTKQVIEYRDAGMRW